MYDGLGGRENPFTGVFGTWDIRLSRRELEDAAPPEILDISFDSDAHTFEEDDGFRCLLNSCAC